MNGIMKYISRIYRTSGVIYNNRLRDDGLNQCQHPYIFTYLSGTGYFPGKVGARNLRQPQQRHPSAGDDGEGLIVRKQDEQDRRIWRVYPTERMEQLLLPRARQVMREWNEYLLEPLTQEEREILESAMEKITARANEAAQETLRGKERQP